MSQKKLIITESPTKARALANSIGDKNNFVFASCYGRILDLEPLSPDDFLNSKDVSWTPLNPKNLAYIEKIAKNADEIFIATDPDIEGEVIAWQLDQLFRHIKIPQGRITRIEIDSFTRQGIEKSLASPSSVSIEKAQSGISRRIFDNFSQFNIPDEAIKARPYIKGSSSRVAAPTLKSIADYPLDTYSIKYQRDGMRLPALLTINAEQDYDRVKRLLERLPPPVFSCVEKESKKLETAGLDFQSLLLKSKELTEAPQEKIYDTLQNLYVKGKISYFRTDSREISPEHRDHVKRELKGEGADNIQFPEIANANSTKVQEGHWAISPLGPIGEALTDFRSMDFESQILSIVWRHWVLNTQERTISTERGVLEPNAFENDVWKSLEKDHNLIFKNEKISTKYGKEAQYDSLFKPLGIKRLLCDSSKNHIAIAHSKEESLIRRMIDLEIGRPSTLVHHCSKIISGYIGNNSKLNSRGLSSVIENSKCGNKLLDIEKSRLIERELLTPHTELESDQIIRKALQTAGYDVKEAASLNMEKKPKRHHISWGNVGM